MVAQTVKKLVSFYGTPKFRYCVHKSLNLEPILSQLNSLNITLPTNALIVCHLF